MGNTQVDNNIYLQGWRKGGGGLVMRLMSLCVAFACLFSITLVNKEKEEEESPQTRISKCIRGKTERKKKIPALPDDINQHL